MGRMTAAASAPGRVLRVGGQPARCGRPDGARRQGGRRRLLSVLGRRDPPARAAARSRRAAGGDGEERLILRSAARPRPLVLAPFPIAFDDPRRVLSRRGRDPAAVDARVSWIAAGAAGRSPPPSAPPGGSTRRAAARPTFRTAKVERGNVTSVVSASGSLSAVTTVAVGSQISGQIKELFVDFNSQVKKGQLLARIDPETFELKVRQAEADLEAARTQLAQPAGQRADAALAGDCARGSRPTMRRATSTARSRCSPRASSPAPSATRRKFTYDARRRGGDDRRSADPTPARRRSPTPQPSSSSARRRSPARASISTARRSSRRSTAS